MGRGYEPHGGSGPYPGQGGYGQQRPPGRDAGYPQPGYGPSPGYPPPGSYQEPGYGPGQGYGPPQGYEPRRDEGYAPAEDPGPVTDDDRQWAVMSYLGIFLAGILAPVIVFVVKSGRPFARHHATQALNLSIALAACGIVGLIATWISFVFGLIVLLVVTAGGMVALVMGARGASQGEWSELPPVLAWPLLR